jgi:putative ABC transport system permease protein
MWRNYLKTAWRNMRRNKLFTSLNVCGLALGLACSILILLWVQDEWSYDRFNPDADKIFRLVETVKSTSQPQAPVPTAFAAAIRREVPQALKVTRVYPTTHLLTAGTEKFEERRVFYADTSFLTIFNYPLLRGNKATVLESPQSVVLTAATAIKYFGSIEKAMGGAVFDESDSVMRQVTGVLANVPHTSHLQFDVLLPAANWDQHMDQTQTWRYFDSHTYVELAQSDAGTIHAIENQLNGIRDKAILGTPAVPATLTLQPLTDIHLRSHFENDLDGMGDITYVRIFSLVAVFILLIACVNFMNQVKGGRVAQNGWRPSLATNWAISRGVGVVGFDLTGTGTRCSCGRFTFLQPIFRQGYRAEFV